MRVPQNNVAVADVGHRGRVCEIVIENLGSLLEEPEYPIGNRQRCAASGIISGITRVCEMDSGTIPLERGLHGLALVQKPAAAEDAPTVAVCEIHIHDLPIRMGGEMFVSGGILVFSHIIEHQDVGPVDDGFESLACEEKVGVDDHQIKDLDGDFFQEAAMAAPERFGFGLGVVVPVPQLLRCDVLENPVRATADIGQHFIPRRQVGGIHHTAVEGRDIRKPSDVEFQVRKRACRRFDGINPRGESVFCDGSGQNGR